VYIFIGVYIYVYIYTLIYAFIYRERCNIYVYIYIWDCIREEILDKLGVLKNPEGKYICVYVYMYVCMYIKVLGYIHVYI
jgi:hypothetical protein